MIDSLGDRIKNYEDRTRYFLPRRTLSLIRLDGKSFHSYTKNLKKPFDDGLSWDIDQSVINILPEIQGAKFAYCQSDEISILLTDFETPTTATWFDGNVQKISSVSASLLTAEFNKLRLKRDCCKTGFISQYAWDNIALASFDARVFTIPDRIEVMNYFIWRNNDCSRNSISMVAQSHFPHKELQNKSSSEMQEMLFTQKGVNWSEFREDQKNGRLIIKEKYLVGEVERNRWVSAPAWKFTQDKDKLMNMIPNYPV